jgi:anti-sigma28 factor (negative regulator of flagellin synthesis)
MGKEETGSKSKKARKAIQDGGSMPGTKVLPRGAKKGDKRKTILDGVALVTAATSMPRLAAVAALAHRELVLRTQKVKQVKAQLAQGTYRVNAQEVAKAIVRREVARLLGEETGSRRITGGTSKEGGGACTSARRFG